MSKIKDVLARAISLASEQPMSYNEVESLLEDIDTCKVKIWLEEGAILPKYAHKEDACMDLFVKNIELNGGRIIYHTGVHVALPEDYEMEIRPRNLIDMDPRKGLVRIRDGAGFRGVERGGCLHRNYLNLLEDELGAKLSIDLIERYIKR